MMHEKLVGRSRESNPCVWIVSPLANHDLWLSQPLVICVFLIITTLWFVLLHQPAKKNIVFDF